MNIIQEPQIITQAYKQGKKIFVLVYMNGCPYCEPLIPIWNKIDIEISQNPKYNSHIKIAKIERANLDKVSQYIKKIESFPTFLHLGKGEALTKHEPDRNHESLLAWVKKLAKHRPYTRYSKGGRKNKRKTRKNKKK
jgi:thiol-disulfide isomerase/thioredoxin